VIQQLQRVSYRETGGGSKGTEGSGVELVELRETIRGVIVTSSRWSRL
jgi:hypothetical protein